MYVNGTWNLWRRSLVWLKGWERLALAWFFFHIVLTVCGSMLNWIRYSIPLDFSIFLLSLIEQKCQYRIATKWLRMVFIITLTVKYLLWKRLLDHFFSFLLREEIVVPDHRKQTLDDYPRLESGTFPVKRSALIGVSTESDVPMSRGLVAPVESPFRRAFPVFR